MSRLKRMPATATKIVLWRTEVDNKPGALAPIIEPPAKAGADQHIIMGYRYAGAEGIAKEAVRSRRGRFGSTGALVSQARPLTLWTFF